MKLLFIALVVLQAPPTPVTVMTKDGKTFRGTLTVPSIQLKTSFGDATFEIDKIHSIELGNPDVVMAKDQVKLQGTIQWDEWTLVTANGEQKLTRSSLRSVFADQSPAVFEPAKVVDGTARNRMTYHVRVPAAFDPEKSLPAIVILHGSNMNAKSYVETIVAAWPKLSEDYILIGINGEYRVPQSPADNPAFNYSGVNYMGKSKYQGFAGTDRESPGLIPEVIEELRERLRIGKVFLGGHSQGGFVTYNVFMNFPDRIAGAFPISAGPWMQSEPTAFDNSALRAAQRRGALAVIHGENDPVVAFSQGKGGFDSFDDDGFPAIHLFTDKAAGHMFARLPVDRAVRWLEQMTSDDPKMLMEFAEDRLKAGEYRDATAALERLTALGGDFDQAKLMAINQRIDQAAEPDTKRLMPLIAGSTDDGWVKEFFEFRARFQFAHAARPVMEAYQNLRARHEEPATKLWNEARQAFQRGDQNAGYAKYDEIVKRYYASSWYRYAKPAVENRPAGAK